MRKKKGRINPKFVSLGVATLLLILTFALIGFVALSVLVGSNVGVGPNLLIEQPLPGPAATPSAAPLETPAPLGMTTYKDTALGFEFQYPKAWHKKQKGLEV